MIKNLVYVVFYRENSDETDSFFSVYYESFPPYREGQTIWLEANGLYLQSFEIVKIEHSIKESIGSVASGIAGILILTKMEVTVRESK